jgi:PIN domain nuclease of toxin-antitoxin system
VIVLDSHIWYWWVNLEHDRLPPGMVAQLASIDSHFPAYPELAGRLIGSV